MSQTPSGVVLYIETTKGGVFYYVGNIVKNLQGRYDGITRKSTAGCTIAEGDFLIMQEISSKIYRDDMTK